MEEDFIPACLVQRGKLQKAQWGIAGVVPRLDQQYSDRAPPACAAGESIAKTKPAGDLAGEGSLSMRLLAARPRRSAAIVLSL